MVDTITAVLLVVRLLVLTLGILITYYSFEAYRRTGTYYMRNATIGFAIITLSVFIEGGYLSSRALTSPSSTSSSRSPSVLDSWFSSSHFAGSDGRV